MATVRILLGIICLAFASGVIKSGSDILGVGDWKVGKLKSWNVAERPATAPTSTLSSASTLISKRTTRDEERFNLENWKVERLESWHVAKRTTANEQRIAKQVTVNRQQILTIAKSQIGVHEATGNNDGLEVEGYLNYTSNKKGEPWCASFVSWVFGKAGFNQPKSAWSPALFPKDKQVQDPAVARVFGIYFSKLKRIAHCGIISKVSGNWIYTIEGNTNVAGSREGDGVYQRIRHKRSIKFYAEWLSGKGSWP